MSEIENESKSEIENQKKNGSPLVKTAVFVALIATVLGVFFYLSSLDKPPTMPNNEVHKLRFDAKGRFMGLDMDIPKEVQSAVVEGSKYDKKAVEKTVHARCKSCHGSVPEAGEKLESRVCTQMGAPCMPLHHPPKEACLKCHRTGPKAYPTEAKN